jgi:hypothetical protein
MAGVADGEREVEAGELPSGVAETGSARRDKTPGRTSVCRAEQSSIQGEGTGRRIGEAVEGPAGEVSADPVDPYR